MACVTLKRPLDPFDQMHVTTRASKRRRCAPLSSPITTSQLTKESCFGPISPKLTKERILENIRNEYRLFQRRKRLSSHLHRRDDHMDRGSSPLQCRSPPGSPMSSGSEGLSTDNRPRSPDIPLFTMKQVGIICDKLAKEREDQIREEYDKILSLRLAEQYDMFVRFTHDQLLRQLSTETPAYIS